MPSPFYAEFAKYAGIVNHTEGLRLALVSAERESDHIRTDGRSQWTEPGRITIRHQVQGKNGVITLTERSTPYVSGSDISQVTREMIKRDGFASIDQTALRLLQIAEGKLEVNYLNRLGYRLEVKPSGGIRMIPYNPELEGKPSLDAFSYLIEKLVS